jgi:hypothetical protein
MSSLLFGTQQPVMQSPVTGGVSPSIGQSLAASAVNAPLQGPMSPAGPSTGSFFSNLGNLGNAVGDFLGGTGGQLIGAGLSIDELNKITDIAQRSAAEQAAIGREAQEATAFRPFTVSTGFGGITATPTGGYATTLSPAMAAQQQALQGITSGLLGGMGGMEPPRIAGGMQAPRAPYDLTAAERTGFSGIMEQAGSAPAQRFQLRPTTPNRFGTSPASFEDLLTGEVVSQEQMEAIQAQGPDPRLADPAAFRNLVDERIQRQGQDLLTAQQRALGQQPPQAPMAPSTGGFGAGIPDVSGIQQQALGGVGGFLTGAMAPMAQREADVYERIRATQRPEEQRQQLALEERLAAQGRTGLRTAQFGGSPEQLALAQAQEEAKARASLAALEQAQAEQLQQMGLAESMFGLGGRAAALPASLQAGQLGNIGAAMELQYLPEQQLLASLTPAISLADIAGVGQRQGAGLMAEAGISGLEDILQAETVRSQNLRDIYSTILGAQANQQAANTAAATNTGLFSSIGNIGNAIVDLFT